MRKKNIILALILIGAFFLISCKTEKESETQNVTDAGTDTQVYASEFVKQLYALKNPYIGNSSANGLLIAELHKYFQVENYLNEIALVAKSFANNISIKIATST
jgi:PBP1b-binding outer membrane lipoprotein LpoB